MAEDPSGASGTTIGRDELQGLAGRGDPVAQRLLAEMRLAEPEGDADARSLLEGAAEAGDAQAQFRLGLLHARGEHGVARDEAAAARWCLAAAKQGLGAAQFNLALMHLAGQGLPRDADAAARWLRIAAANGVEEAEDCLTLGHEDGKDPATRPATWDEADTRISVVLIRSGSKAGKSLRFAEFYLDPCIDLLIKRYRFSREQSEDIVQQFMLELEEPLERGEDRGLAWKDSLRRKYDPQLSAGRFRAYLSRVLRNFAFDWSRRENPTGTGDAPVAAPDPAWLVEHHAEAWRALLARFTTSIAGTGNPKANEAARVLDALLVEELRQPEVAARLDLSERTIRNRLRLGSELLCGWLGDHVTAANAAHPELAEGLRLLPDWLHYPVGINRQRILLYLALVGRRTGGAAPPG